jgi:dienelactone hydrolase
MTSPDGHYAATEVRIELADAVLQGDLVETANAPGVVVFAHGSGSSRLSSRNRRVAAALNRAGFSTLLFDLLTDLEEQADLYTAEYRFDIPMLAGRLTRTVDWLRGRAGYEAMSVGLFGASTGAAAALITASERPGVVQAVVSRGGRPDLAMRALSMVKAPTLLIVGSNDTEVLQLNRRAAGRLTVMHEVAIVRGATHLFEEPGALEEVAGLASAWFGKYLA